MTRALTTRPQPLVEFVTSQVLTADRLANNPTVCDPACGSGGIFLVEAYRRIVRWEMTRRERRLTTAELQELLLTRVAGIDINAEAVRLAAFSLYLAYLSYQSPPDIRDAGPLPRLIEGGCNTPSTPGSGCLRRFGVDARCRRTLGRGAPRTGSN